METHLLFWIFRLWAWFHPFVILSSRFVSLPVIPVLALLASPCFGSSHVVLGSALCCWWLCAGGSVCCLLCGGLRDEDQYLLRHSSPALDHDSPCGQHMLLAHLEHQDKEQLQCTLARLENENRSVSRKNKREHGLSLERGSFFDSTGWWGLNCMFAFTQSVQTRLIERIVAHQWSARTVTCVIHLLVLRLDVENLSICILVLKEGSLYEYIESVVTPTTKILISYPYNNVPGATFVAMTHMNIFFHVCSDFSATCCSAHTHTLMDTHQHTHTHMPLGVWNLDPVQFVHNEFLLLCHCIVLLWPYFWM